MTTDLTARPPAWKAWLLASRPATLLAGAVPVFVGIGVAVSEGGFALLPALAALAAALLVQIATNLANDYFDFRKGADTDARVGPARAAQKGWLTPEQIRNGTVVVLVAAGLVGAYLATVGGWPVVAIAVASVVCAVAYTGGPLPLAYVGLGDVFVLGFFGLVATTGTAYVQTLSWSVDALLAGLAVGLLATGILVVNNLRDRHTDVVAGKRTLAVRLGATAVRWEYTLCMVGAYAAVGARAAAGDPGWLLPMLSLPLGIRQVRAIWTTDGPALNPHLGATARLELVFGLLLAAGIALS